MRPTFQEGQKIQLPFSVDEKQMQLFAQVSGDYNPVHLEASYAQKNGFKGPVVYGALLVSVVSRLLGMECPGPGCVWHSVSMQFKSPLYMNEQAELLGTVTYLNSDLRLLRLSLEIKRGADLLATGQAQAGWLVEASAS